MPVYRYSPAGLDSIVRTSRRTRLLAYPGGLTIGSLVAILKTPQADFLYGVAIWALLMIPAVWFALRPAKASREFAAASEFELNDGALITRNPQGEMVIQRGSVRLVTRMGDGIMIRGSSIRESVLLTPQLEGFEDLEGRLRVWIPAPLTLQRSALSLAHWAYGYAGAACLLTVCALVFDQPAIAIPSCLLGAALYAWCSGGVLVSPHASRRLKLAALTAIVPVVGLVLRAWELWP